ncbi:2944_t:CDS:1 [Paraglomus brasilianum]|uniref:2944_t:CDS:1 n=1 Tax=Paraglomus brasilianum TaxID=144538 RepID=A0A9N9FF42_9GLOM|nr:2944_t:CDS:1 [Paraglomus brasilianum]
MLHLTLLTLTILAFPGLTDALFKELDENSDPITESIFDLMATVLIASIITVDVKRISDEKKFLQKLFLYISYGLSYFLSIPLQIWFMVKAYRRTRDRFFYVYLVITFLQDITFFIFIFMMRCTSLQKKYIALLPSLLQLLTVFAKELIFLFLAVRRRYVNPSAYWFVLGPIFLAFFIGITLYLYAIKRSKELNSEELYEEHGFKELINMEEADRNEVLKRTLSNFMKIRKITAKKFRRASWIIGFCLALTFCLIMAPSVLWAKAYIMLRFVCFTTNDIEVKLQEIIDEEDQNNSNSQ